MKKLKTPSKKISTIRLKPGINTLNEMFERKSKTFNDINSLVQIKNSTERVYKYSDVYDYVTKIAKHLNELGLKKGDKVAILGENSAEWAISYFAIQWAGCIAVPLDARGDMKTLKYILDFASTKAIFTTKNFESVISEFLQQSDSLKNLLLLEEIDEITVKYEYGLQKTAVKPDDLCEILFTSGTTGNPKGVMLTHKNIMSNIEDIYSILDINPGDRILSILPIHHAYEKTGGFLSTFYSGVTIYHGSGLLNPREMLNDLKYVKPTVWINTPLILEKLFSRIKRELENQSGLKGLIIKLLPKKTIGKKIKKELGLDKLKLLVSGGAALPQWVSNGLEDLSFQLIQGYGLSETSPLITANPPSNPRNSSVGMVIPSDEVEIRETDSDGNGEIYVKGPNVMIGYYNNQEATKEVLSPDGWLNTGDIGYFDEDGYLYLTGRKKYVIVTPGGKNVFPEELEQKFLKSPLIEEIMVFSPDDKEIQAIIYPNLDEIKEIIESSEVSYQDHKVWDLINKTVKQINSDTEAYKKISNFAIKTEEFDKTSTRKIKRFLFKDLNLNNDIKYL